MAVGARTFGSDGYRGMPSLSALLLVTVFLLGLSSLAPANSELTLQRGLRLDPEQAPPGGEVDVIGTGFQGGDAGDIYFDYEGSDPQDVGDFSVAQGDDSFTVPIEVPNRSEGQYSIAAVVPDPDGTRLLASTTLTVASSATARSRLDSLPLWLLAIILLLSLFAMAVLLWWRLLRKRSQPAWVLQHVRVEPHESPAAEVVGPVTYRNGSPTLAVKVHKHRDAGEHSLEEATTS
jgi:hypothetical protein